MVAGALWQTCSAGPLSCGGLVVRCARGVRFRLLAAAVTGVAAAGSAAAAQWVAAPSIGSRVFYDDNVSLQSGNPKGAWSAVVSPSLDLSRKTEVSDLSLSGGLHFRRYSGRRGLNSNDASLKAAWTRRVERGSWGLSAGYVHNTTLTSELLDTGLIQQIRRRNAVDFGANWTRQLSERNSFRVSYGYADIAYSGAGTLVGYTTQHLSGALIHQSSPRLSWTTSVNASHTDVPDTHGKTTTYNFQESVNWRYSETVTAALSVGAWRSQQTSRLVLLPFLYLDQANRSSGALWSASVNKQFERTTIAASFSHSFTPSSIGRSSQSDALSLNVDHKLSPKIELTVVAQAFRRRDVFVGTLGGTRTYYRVGPGVHWRLDRDWTASAAYRYSRQDLGSGYTPAGSNRVTLSLTYNWPRYSISR